jgi:hypothetical protein
MPPLLKTLWVLWCVGGMALLMFASSRRSAWPAWGFWALVAAFVAGHVVFGRFVSRFRR